MSDPSYVTGTNRTDVVNAIASHAFSEDTNCFKSIATKSDENYAIYELLKNGGEISYAHLDFMLWDTSSQSIIQDAQTIVRKIDEYFTNAIASSCTFQDEIAQRKILQQPTTIALDLDPRRCSINNFDVQLKSHSMVSELLKTIEPTVTLYQYEQLRRDALK